MTSNDETFSKPVSATAVFKGSSAFCDLRLMFNV